MAPIEKLCNELEIRNWVSTPRSMSETERVPKNKNNDSMREPAQHEAEAVSPPKITSDPVRLLSPCGILVEIVTESKQLIQGNHITFPFGTHIGALAEPAQIA
ncbi:hypothetical protein GYMLUDRAFT_64589 [Collybiopsis luxurians FD-317 M1]|uniref:Uncharacterized protein n=1 Tax=Collybiopsis luxurians FD-317 M1 TaxID=944289 RepID=A0A0D0C1Z4_9AGAR|nr:hypothetical protein GYMLUDRAFT_64589 [Collybiopsis luxurians FD-317 M1]